LGNKKVNVHTFHSLAYSILADKNRQPEIVSPVIKSQLIKKLKSSIPDFKFISTKDLELQISLYKSSDQKNKKYRNLVEEYNSELKKIHKLDFDDLVSEAFKVSKKPCYEFIIIDEFQDTNTQQFEFAITLLKSNKIIVIGDPLQSIYSFRGAHKTIFEYFKNKFSDFEEITLETNYRSDKKIIDLASQIFPNEFTQSPFSQNDGHVGLIETFNEYSEADWIIKRISQIMGGMDMLEGSRLNSDLIENKKARFSDFAVIYRKHSLARILERKLDESGLPFQTTGEKSIYNYKNVRIIINCLKFVNGNQNAIIDIASNQFQISNEKIEELKELDKDSNLFDLIKNSLKQKNISSRNKKFQKLYNFLVFLKELNKSQNTKQLAKLISENLEIIEEKNHLQFINDLDRFDSLEKFLEQMEIIEESEFYDKTVDRITLLTLHASKGLEFKYVFIIGFEKGQIPLEHEGIDIEEEKRLFYVGVTRAKNFLEILKTQSRNREKTEISEFEKFFKDNEKLADPEMKKIKKKNFIRKEKKSQMGFNF
jgi:DNA helicase-2/ATP-dependent DNA helicase PcrA